MSLVQDFFNFAIPVLDSVPFIRGILSFILVCFLPGFAWSLILFKQINYLERILLSFGLSIALVTLGVMFLNMVLKIRITGINSLLTIIIITAIPLAVYFIRKRLLKRRGLEKSDNPEVSGE